MKDISSNSKTLEVLKAMQEADVPVGAIYLGEALSIPQSSVGRMLIELESEGYIEKISNKGRILSERGKSYISQYSRHNDRLETAAKLIYIHEEIPKERLLEIMEIRLLLEERAVELACRNGTDEEIKELEKIMLEYKLNLHEGGLGNQQDLQLHLTIAKMSGNNTLYNICALLLTQDDAYSRFSDMADNIATIQTQQHEAIVLGIKSRDVAAAKKAIHQHLIQVREDIEANYETKSDLNVHTMKTV